MSVVDAPAPNPAGPASPGHGFWLKFLLKRHLRRHLRLGRMNGEVDDSQQQAIQFVLDTPEALDELAASVTDYASANGEQPMLSELDATTPPAPTGPQRPIGRFLQWLWNNRQQILQFVLMIVGLFGGPKIALPTGAASQQVWSEQLTAEAINREGFGVEVCDASLAHRSGLQSGSGDSWETKSIHLLDTIRCTRDLIYNGPAESETLKLKMEAISLCSAAVKELQKIIGSFENN